MSYQPRLSSLAGFKSEKAAQVAAFFASKQPGIEKLKLIKLLYLAERENISAYGHPMLYDELYSVRHGPICSSSLNGINQKPDGERWSQYIQLEGNKNVVPHKIFERGDLDELSEADLRVLEAIWDRFGAMSAPQIRRWTHENCPEYTEIEDGRLPISYESLCNAIGAGEESDDLEQRIRYDRRVASLFRSR